MCIRDSSDGWYFFSCYNTEQANTLLEVEASQKDKDFIMAVNWKKVEGLVAGGKGTMMETKYAHNKCCLLYTSPSPRDRTRYRMPSSA